MITRKADYAIRVVEYLTCNMRTTQWVSSTDLARAMEIPYRFLRNIVRLLVQNGIVESQRGCSGGLRLARRPDQLSVAEVVHAVDETGLLLNICLQKPSGCGRMCICPLHTKLKQLQKTINDTLAATMFNCLANLSVRKRRRVADRAAASRK
ncbi:MAG: Rrf2 family transcriptional regulator [bacterium]|nr:Rrf2 family transcriptional regulator [bacterium]